MMLFSHQIATFAKRDIGTRAPMTAAALGVVVLLAFGGVARAENECGAPEPGVELTCSPSNYDSAEDGNIFYGPDESNGDFTIRLTDDLVLDYDREAPGDDFYSLPGDPESRRYSAVWITPTETGYGYTGDISVFSSADVTSNARGISVGHYGESGALRMELTGGTFTTNGEVAYGIASYHEGAGNIDIIARNLTVNTNGPFAYGIISAHRGEGDISIIARNLAVNTNGPFTDGIASEHRGEGDINIIARNLAVNTNGPFTDGIASEHRGEGDINIDVRDATFTVTGESAGGIYAWHGGEKGNVNVDAQGLTINTMGDRSIAITGFHEGAGAINVNVRDATFTVTGESADGIYAWHGGEKGNVNVDAQGLTIAANGRESRGVFVHQGGEGDSNVTLKEVTIIAQGFNGRGIHSQHVGTGDVHLDVQGGAITTDGGENEGLFALHVGTGNIDIDVGNATFTVTGDSSEGIYVSHGGEKGNVNVDAQGLTIAANGRESRGVFVHQEGESDSNVTLKEVTIMAQGFNGEGIRSQHVGTGDVHLDVQGGAITTDGAESHGLVAGHTGTGDIHLDVQGGAITTDGGENNGLVAVHTGTGDINVDAQGLTIAANGTESNGVYGDHRGAEGDVHIDVRGGRITTRGVNSHGIYARHTNPTDADENPLTDAENNVIPGTGGITVGMTGGESSTQGDGSHGIYAEHESGIGEIRIGVDGGTIRAGGMDASGIQIGRLNEEEMVERAAGVGEDGYRKQSVMVNGRVWGGTGEAAGVYLAGGGRVMIGREGSLGAESGVAIRATGNAPKLYVDANLAGRRMARVIHGDVRNDGGETTLLINGVTLHDGVTGATGLEVLNGAWDVTLRAGEPLADRDFSAKDFIEVYAPRAAVYEALPGLLLRLNSRGPAGERFSSPGSPGWVRVAGGAGRYAAAQASVGAKYDFHRVLRWKPGWTSCWGSVSPVRCRCVTSKDPETCPRRPAAVRSTRGAWVRPSASHGRALAAITSGAGSR